MNEEEQFLNDLLSDQGEEADIAEEPQTPTEEQNGDGEVTDEPDGTDDIGELKPRSRRERRLMRKLEAERQSAITLAQKLEEREYARSAITEERDYLKAVERIYGNETPDAILATDLLKKAIIGARDDAKREALEEIRLERAREREAEENATQLLDSFIDDIEDTYDVTLTESQERAYFTLLQKMSPKDNEGNVVQYADPHSVWEVFQERLQSRGTDNRAKTLSHRSMVQSGASTQTNLQDEVSEKFLKENSII